MKRFLWLVVALATMVLVGCSNNAGGGTGGNGDGNLGDAVALNKEEILSVLEGTWETEGYSNGRYQKIFNPENPNEYLEYAFQYIFTKDLQGITEEDIDFFRTDIGGVLTLIQNLKFGDTNWDYYSDSKNATDKSIFCYLDVYQDGNFLINLKENEDPDYDITTMKISGNKLYIQDMNGDYTICLEKVK